MTEVDTTPRGDDTDTDRLARIVESVAGHLDHDDSCRLKDTAWLAVQVNALTDQLAALTRYHAMMRARLAAEITLWGKVAEGLDGHPATPEQVAAYTVAARDIRRILDVPPGGFATGPARAKGDVVR